LLWELNSLGQLPQLRVAARGFRLPAAAPPGRHRHLQ
jgi:hypothetical protein